MEGASVEIAGQIAGDTIRRADELVALSLANRGCVSWVEYEVRIGRSINLDNCKRMKIWTRTTGVINNMTGIWFGSGPIGKHVT